MLNMLFEMVITYRANLRPPYIGNQSAQIDPDLRFIYSLTLGHSRDIQQKKISKPVNHPSLDVKSEDIIEIVWVASICVGVLRPKYGGMLRWLKKSSKETCIT